MHLQPRGSALVSTRRLAGSPRAVLDAHLNSSLSENVVGIGSWVLDPLNMLGFLGRDSHGSNEL